MAPINARFEDTRDWVEKGDAWLVSYYISDCWAGKHIRTFKGSYTYDHQHHTMDSDADRFNMDDPRSYFRNDTPRRLPIKVVVWELHEMTGLRTLGGGLRCFLNPHISNCLKPIWSVLCDQHSWFWLALFWLCLRYLGIIYSCGI